MTGHGGCRSWILRGPAPISGTVRVPGDKSISHRALLLGAMAHGVTEIEGLLRSEDCLATLGALRALGVEIVEGAGGAVCVNGQGPEGLREPEMVLDLGNSGTTLRLLAGLLAGRPFFSLLSGDASLCRRPVRRIVEPLRTMGATLLGRSQDGFPPLAVRGGGLSGVAWHSPIASAQVKSAILLAGLQARGETSITEPILSRDHTERMLVAFGVTPKRAGTRVAVSGGSRLRGARLVVPGDLSSAAFFLAAGAGWRGSGLRVEGVGVNPTRTGILDVLAEMGAPVAVERGWDEGGEPVADLAVRGARLRGVRIEADLIPRLIDEIPVLAVVAALAEGETVIEGAGELRVKEVDRLTAVRDELARLGAAVSVTGDRLTIRGGMPLSGAVVSSGGDHRMAMSLAIAALFAEGETTIRDVGCVETSFPGFAGLLSLLAPECGICEVKDDV